MPRSANPIVLAIDQVFGDTSVSRATTRAELVEAQDHLEILLDSLHDAGDEEEDGEDD